MNPTPDTVREDSTAFLEEYHQRTTASGSEPACKIDGCWNPAEKKLGPYGGLCAEHREERKAAKNGSVQLESKPAKKVKLLTLTELATQIEETQTHLNDLAALMRARLDAL